MRHLFTYSVLDQARKISQDSELDILEMRKYLGVPLANDIRQWMVEQPTLHRLVIDFHGVRAISASVAEELGPLLMQSVQQSPALEQKYPILRLDKFEHAYTFAASFSNINWTGLALVSEPVEANTFISVIGLDSESTVAVLGQLSRQMEQVLAFANKCADEDKPFTSETLSELDFLADVTLAARSKRLTELYARRLLAFRENLRNPKERLFFPAWRLS